MSSTNPRHEHMIGFPPAHTGLGNRVRAVLGVHSLAEVEGRSFAYVWSTGRNFGARMTDLWEYPERRVPAALSRALSVRYPYLGNKIGHLDDAARGRRIIQIRTGHALDLPPEALAWEQRLRDLRPAPPVCDAVGAFHARHLSGAPYVGVMVRAHPVSHELTREHSPVSWFVDRMHQLENELPGVPFFLSCDVPDVQAAILERFPTACAQTKSDGYNTKGAVVASVADLYLLAGSSHVVAPYYSSFPEMAQHLAGPAATFETSMATVELDDVVLSVADDPTRPSIR